MAIFPIRTFPDPVLSMRASDVIDFDADLRRLVDDMLETMFAAPGVGLAAPQIGISKRIRRRPKIRIITDSTISSAI